MPWKSRFGVQASRAVSFFSRMIYPDGVELLFFAAVNLRRIYGTEEADLLSPEQINQLFGKDVPEEIKSFDRSGTMFIGERGRMFVNHQGAYGKPVEQLAMVLRDSPILSEENKSDFTC